jgi:hypothetical protein
MAFSRRLYLPAEAPTTKIGVFREWIGTIAGSLENTVTEWAALGMACLLISLYAKLRIQAVTGQGDRFDG